MSGRTKEEPVAFLNQETNVTYQVYSPNGLMWYVKTGNMVPIETPNGTELAEEEIGYPWEKFIEQFLPQSQEAGNLMSASLEPIVEAYTQKLERISGYLKICVEHAKTL